MTDRVIVDGLSIARVLHEFIRNEVLPGTGVPEAGFWTRFDRIVHDLAPKNRALLKKRDDLQA
jgi:malate synthase